MEPEDEGESSSNNESVVVSMDFDWHNSQSGSSLHQATRAKNKIQVKRLLKQHSNPNIPDNRGWTPVHVTALGNKYVAVLKILISYGAFLDHITHEGETPLLLACKYGSWKIVKLLLKNGCSVNQVSLDRTSPLHAACTTKNTKSLELLLKTNCNLNVFNADLMTPLFVAIQNNNISACKLLIDGGASLVSRDTFGRSPLHLACSVLNLELFQMIAHHSGGEVFIKSECSPGGWTLLMEAVQFKNLAVVEYLLELGVDPDRVNDRQHLALHLAAHSGNVQCLKLVLEHTSTDAIQKYCTFSTHMKNNRSLLGLALDSKDLDCLYTLFDANLSHDVLTCPILCSRFLLDSYSFLIMYCFSVSLADKVTFLKLLLSKGVPLNLEYDFCGARRVSPVESVFYLHMDHRKSDCFCRAYLKLLLGHGADPDKLRNHKGGLSVLPKSFRMALHLNFNGGLALLFRFSNLIEPDDILPIYTKWLLSLSYVFTGHAIETFMFLSKFCTNLNSAIHVLSLDNISGLKGERHEQLLNIRSFLLKQSPHSLKHLCRGAIRKEIHRITQPDTSTFREKLCAIQIPSSIISYLSYDEMLTL